MGDETAINAAANELISYSPRTRSLSLRRDMPPYSPSNLELIGDETGINAAAKLATLALEAGNHEAANRNINTGRTDQKADKDIPRNLDSIPSNAHDASNVLSERQDSENIQSGGKKLTVEPPLKFVPAGLQCELLSRVQTTDDDSRNRITGRADHHGNWNRSDVNTPVPGAGARRKTVRLDRDTGQWVPTVLAPPSPSPVVANPVEAHSSRNDTPAGAHGHPEARMVQCPSLSDLEPGMLRPRSEDTAAENFSPELKPDLPDLLDGSTCSEIEPTTTACDDRNDEDTNRNNNNSPADQNNNANRPTSLPVFSSVGPDVPRYHTPYEVHDSENREQDSETGRYVHAGFSLTSDWLDEARRGEAQNMRDEMGEVENEQWSFTGSKLVTWAPGHASRWGTMSMEPTTTACDNVDNEAVSRKINRRPARQNATVDRPKSLPLPPSISHDEPRHHAESKRPVSENIDPNSDTGRWAHVDHLTPASWLEAVRDVKERRERNRALGVAAGGAHRHREAQIADDMELRDATKELLSPTSDDATFGDSSPEPIPDMLDCSQRRSRWGFRGISRIKKYLHRASKSPLNVDDSRKPKDVVCRASRDVARNREKILICESMSSRPSTRERGDGTVSQSSYSCNVTPSNEEQRVLERNYERKRKPPALPVACHDETLENQRSARRELECVGARLAGADWCPGDNLAFTPVHVSREVPCEGNGEEVWIKMSSLSSTRERGDSTVSQSSYSWNVTPSEEEQNLFDSNYGRRRKLPALPVTCHDKTFQNLRSACRKLDTDIREMTRVHMNLVAEYELRRMKSREAIDPKGADHDAPRDLAWSRDKVLACESSPTSHRSTSERERATPLERCPGYETLTKEELAPHNNHGRKKVAVQPPLKFFPAGLQRELPSRVQTTDDDSRNRIAVGESSTLRLSRHPSEDSVSDDLPRQRWIIAEENLEDEMIPLRTTTRLSPTGIESGSYRRPEEREACEDCPPMYHILSRRDYETPVWDYTKGGSSTEGRKKVAVQPHLKFVPAGLQREVPSRVQTTDDESRNRITDDWLERRYAMLGITRTRRPYEMAVGESSTLRLSRHPSEVSDSDDLPRQKRIIAEENLEDEMVPLRTTTRLSPTGIESGSYWRPEEREDVPGIRTRKHEMSQSEPSDSSVETELCRIEEGPNPDNYAASPDFHTRPKSTIGSTPAGLRSKNEETDDIDFNEKTSVWMISCAIVVCSITILFYSVLEEDTDTFDIWTSVLLSYFAISISIFTLFYSITE